MNEKQKYIDYNSASILSLVHPVGCLYYVSLLLLPTPDITGVTKIREARIDFSCYGNVNYHNNYHERSIPHQLRSLLVCNPK